jgi:hypothetical protein
MVSSPSPSEPDMRLPSHPALHEHIGWFHPTRAACAGRWSTRPCATSTPGNGAPVFTGDLLPSNHAAYSLDPFGLWAAFPPSSVGRYSHDYYESSATPRRQQRTVRLPRTRGSGGHRRDASHVQHQPVGKVGAQLYPGASPRSTATRRAASPAREANERPRRSRPATRTEHRQQPIAASFGAGHKYRGFHHWFGLPTAGWPRGGRREFRNLRPAPNQ